jgi:hypothetical protein
VLWGTPGHRYKVHAGCKYYVSQLWGIGQRHFNIRNVVVSKCYLTNLILFSPSTLYSGSAPTGA